jgi:tRNA pseudouridine38-40 synthase
MPIYRLDVAYDGSGFRGYAKQRSQRTVQGELEAALRTLIGDEIETSVAGRTDAGVHARGQVVSAELAGEIDVRRLLRSLNGLLGPEIAVCSVGLADDDFNARFSAKWRRYRYLMDAGPVQDPLTRNVTWHVGEDLDLRAMRKVVPALVGEHDFSSFCRSVEGRSNVRRVEEVSLDQMEQLYEFWIKANAFCHQMVRSVVGHIYDVGRGFSSADDIVDVIEARDRSRVATVAPPHGLTLWEVGY